MKNGFSRGSRQQAKASRPDGRIARRRLRKRKRRLGKEHHAEAGHQQIEAGRLERITVASASTKSTGSPRRDLPRPRQHRRGNVDAEHVSAGRPFAPARWRWRRSRNRHRRCARRFGLGASDQDVGDRREHDVLHLLPIGPALAGGPFQYAIWSALRRDLPAISSRPNSHCCRSWSFWRLPCLWRELSVRLWRVVAAHVAPGIDGAFCSGILPSDACTPFPHPFGLRSCSSGLVLFHLAVSPGACSAAPGRSGRRRSLQRQELSCACSRCSPRRNDSPRRRIKQIQGAVMAAISFHLGRPGSGHPDIPGCSRKDCNGTPRLMRRLVAKAIFRREGAPRRWWNNWFGTYALAAVVVIGMLLMAGDPWSPNGRHDPD